MTYIVDVSWDEEAGVWTAVCDEVPLALESNSFDALINKAKGVAYEILEMNSELTDGIKICFKTSHWEKIA